MNEDGGGYRLIHWRTRTGKKKHQSFGNESLVRSSSTRGGIDCVSRSSSSPSQF